MITKDSFNRGILTVGQMKEFLAKYNDDTHIVVATEGWYANIVEVTDTDDEFQFAITLYTKDDFDARQF